MSYDLCIYSRQDVPVTGNALKSDMLAQGWEVRILDTLRGSEPLQLLPDESALQDALLAGWRVEQTNSKLLDAMFAARNKVGLREMCQKEDAFATYRLDITYPFIFDPEDLEFDSEAELCSIVGDEVVDFRKEAKVFYEKRSECPAACGGDE